MPIRQSVCRNGFQSTLPYGSDRRVICSALIVIYFNPRSLTGATIILVSNSQAFFISIHAPLRERPAKVNPFIIYEPYFNPRALTGATNSAKASSPIDSDFNPRSLTGATLFVDFCVVFVIISIHAPLRERRCFGFVG